MSAAMKVVWKVAVMDDCWAAVMDAKSAGLLAGEKAEMLAVARADMMVWKKAVEMAAYSASTKADVKVASSVESLVAC